LSININTKKEQKYLHLLTTPDNNHSAVKSQVKVIATYISLLNFSFHTSSIRAAIHTKITKHISLYKYTTKLS